ncbi:MAG: hypothetical protein Q7K57_61215 [Burkholderiaceae bacterium]|nr:hypothetical protein [Burkholderiaceae bacterium]
MNNAVDSGAVPVTGKYDDVLRPFVSLMERELHANTGKGDRPGWLTLTADQLLLEIYYHVAKLQKAIKDNDGPRVQEHAADVANMAMMALDVCGGLAILELGRPTAAGPDLGRTMPALTDSLREVLGTPVHTMVPLVRLLQLLDPTVKHRYEDEQAALLHWMLTLWFQHGDDWRAAAGVEVGRMREAAALKLQQAEGQGTPA